MGQAPSPTAPDTLAGLTVPQPGQAAAPPPLQVVPNGPATTPPAVAVPVSGLAVEIAARAQSGSNRFEIRLDPPELGRIDVRLHVDSQGQVTSHLVVDRADTLALLRRDSADLEQSLQQAGLKTSDNSLQFSLRDQSSGGSPDHGGRSGMARVVIPQPDSVPSDTSARPYARILGMGSGVDIRV